MLLWLRINPYLWINTIFRISYQEIYCILIITRYVGSNTLNIAISIT